MAHFKVNAPFAVGLPVGRGIGREGTGLGCARRLVRLTLSPGAESMASGVSAEHQPFVLYFGLSCFPFFVWGHVRLIRFVVLANRG
jgi:hypothetical protein